PFWPRTPRGAQPPLRQQHFPRRARICVAAPWGRGAVALRRARMSHRQSPGLAGQALRASLPALEEKHEDDLAAERLWWADALERQVKDIGENFGHQFRTSLDRLRTELAASQEHLEALVEREARERTSEILDVKREIDARFGEAMTRLFQDCGLGPARPALAGGQDGQLSAVRGQLEELRGQLAQSESSRADLDGFARRELESGRAIREAQRVQVSGLEAALSDLRREISDAQERQALSVEDLRRDLATFKEEAHVQEQSNDQVAQLHQLFMQSAGDLGRGIEEVSAGVLATEQKLRRETDQRLRALEARCGKQHTEVLEALARSGEQLAQSICDEAEKRDQEAIVLRTQLDALHGQVEDHRSAGSAEGASAAAALAKETDALRCLVEVAQGDLSRLERAAAEERVAQANIAAELKCNVEHLGKSLANRLETMEAVLRSHVGECIAGERNLRALEVADIRSYAEGILTEASRAVAEGTANRFADTLSANTPAATSTTQDQEQVWKELHRLRASVDAIEALERPQQAEAQTAAFMTAVVARVEALEERTDQQKVASVRLDGVEGALKEMARVSELSQLDAALKRMELDLMPLDSRLDHVESELRRALLETLPLIPRMDAAESEAARLGRDSAAAGRSLASLLTELEGVKTAVAAVSKALADKPMFYQASTVHSFALDNTGTTIDTSEAPLSRPDELRTSISNIVKKVNMTLSASAAPGTQSSQGAPPGLCLRRAADPSMEDSGASFRKALQAVRDLRCKRPPDASSSHTQEGGAAGLSTPRTWTARTEVLKPAATTPTSATWQAQASDGRPSPPPAASPRAAPPPRGARRRRAPPAAPPAR
ncbi:unnamed protein product, partial [Prorocentrum cordatum]